MKIGIPRQLLYYRYQTLIKTFLNELEIDYIISDKSTKKTLEEGKKYIDTESCISMKLLLGHIKNLENKCDYILIPRLKSLKKDEKVCTNYLALYDLANNLSNKYILELNIDEHNKKEEKLAFIKLGLSLGFSYNKCQTAYKKAKKKEHKINNQKILKQNEILKKNTKKILLAGHPYNLYDNLLGKEIINILKENKIDIIYSDIYNIEKANKESKKISKECYFTLNKEIMGSIINYKNNIDGIILLEAFPCGPDSLCNELIIKKIKDKPLLNILIDENTSNTGLITRLESFIDIINKENIYE